MKQTFAGLFLLCFLSVQGQEGPEAQRPRATEQGRDKTRALEFWRKVDENRDQKLSKEEFLSMPRVSPLPQEKQEKLFARLDKDGSGFLEAGELIFKELPTAQDGALGEMKRRPLPRIAEMDLNQDGKISFEEFVQAPMMAKLPEDRRRTIFDKMDRNQDGVLSPEDGPPPGQGMRRPGERGDGKPEARPEGLRPLRPEGEGGRPPQRPNPPDPARGFPALDANRDQVIDFSEFQKFPPVRQMSEDEQEDMFEKIDTNRDLKIQPEEWQSHWKTNKPAQPTQREGPATPARPRPRNAEGEMKDANDEMMEGGN